MEHSTPIYNSTTITEFGLNSTEFENTSDRLQTPNMDTGIYILAKFHLVAIPIITTFGLIGNSLAFFVFISKSLRRTSCSWYLAARSLSDTGFLICLFIMWLGDAFRVRIFHTVVVCQCVIFFTYFFGFLSVWLVVLITCENYIRICHPFTVARFCNIRVAKGFIIGFSVVGVIIYNFSLWTTHITVHGNLQTCSPNDNYLMITRFLTYGDMIITLLIPSIAIILLMVAITLSVIKSYKRQTRLRGKQNCSSVQNGGSYKRSNSPQAKVTRMLFAVSFIFLALNLPSHVVRLRIVLLTFLKHRPSKPTLDQMIQVIFQIIYYMSFAVNLFVYLCCGDNFRKVFVDRYFSCFKSAINRKNEQSHTSFTAMPGRCDFPEIQNKDEEVCKGEEETSLIN
ncbi:thyrotropin-releasing hormone receptor [Patella vulgata]|uniref:thyrotropin-releasing hormone receptor n=1 Tax=Patella vulgata TaxID=6465 RepID=UPI0021809B2D|nr:thyrotropin-releasing hormone receptor [Patella vulgata]